MRRAPAARRRRRASTWSSRRAGAPQNAMMPSPMNLSTVPFVGDRAGDLLRNRPTSARADRSAPFAPRGSRNPPDRRKDRQKALFDAERQWNSGLDQLSHDIQRHERGERVQRVAQQRGGGLQLRDLPDVGWRGTGVRRTSSSRPISIPATRLRSAAHSRGETEIDQQQFDAGQRDDDDDHLPVRSP